MTIEARAARDVSDDSPVKNDHERLTSAVYAWRDRAELLDEVKRPRGHLARLVAGEDTNSHGHDRRGTRDASNGPPDGGLWRVVERLNLGDCQATRRVLAGDPTRLGALHRAATRIARVR